MGLVFFRFLFGALLLVAMGCFAASLITGNLAWRRRGVAILKWTLLAAVAFFAILMVPIWLEPKGA